MQRHEVKFLRAFQLSILNDENTPKPGSIWEHYSGQRYTINKVVFCQKTEEASVCYYSETVKMPMDWMLPLSEWQQFIICSNNKATPMFKHIHSPNIHTL